MKILVRPKAMRLKMHFELMRSLPACNLVRIAGHGSRIGYCTWISCTGRLKLETLETSKEQQTIPAFDISSRIRNRSGARPDVLWTSVEQGLPLPTCSYQWAYYGLPSGPTFRTRPRFLFLDKLESGWTMGPWDHGLF